MKKIIKILLFPLFFVISVLYKTVTFIIGIASGFLGLLSLALIILSVFLFITAEVKTGLIAVLIAWFVSPFGLPLIAQFTLEILMSAKEFLKRKLD